jgi:hypothetical protein
VSRFFSQNSRFWKLTVLFAFACLPVLPELSGALFLIYTICFFRTLEFHALPHLRWFFVVALLGVVAQVLQFVSPRPEPKLGTWGRGLMQPTDAAFLTGWSRGDDSKKWAVERNGFWRVWQNPQASIEEIYVAREYQLLDGVSYTQRFEYRSDVPVEFMISVFTARGHRLVRPVLESSSRDRLRFRVEFVAQPGDGFLRAFDLVALRGPWAWIELGSMELFQTQRGPAQVNTPTWFEQLMNLKPWYWVGSVFLAMSGLVLMKQFLGLLHFRAVGALGFGLMVLLIWIVLNFVDGGIGLPSDKNQLAHGVTMIAALLLMIAPVRTGGLALFVAFGTAVALGARGALLVLAVVTMDFFRRFGFWVSRRSWFAFGLGLIFVFGLVAWQVRPSSQAVQSGFARFEIWRIAWEAIVNRPQGYGPGQFAVEYATSRASDAFDAVVSHPHNLLLGILFEFGWLGLIGFLVLMYVLARQCVTARAWSHLVVIAVAVLLNLFDYTWFTAGVAIPVWLALGVPYNHRPLVLNKNR